MKQLIPPFFKRNLSRFKRGMTDFVDFKNDRFSKSTTTNEKLNFSLKKTQEVKPSETLESKVNNLTLGAQKIQSIVIQPQEIFSFWKTVGAPNLRNGFAKSRTIINGKLIPSTGGGLCQLSGIIYHASLEAGLAIVERHHHSVDIYENESDRYAPLGSDATVVYGYKDLRIRNTFESPIKFEFDVQNHQITISIKSTFEISKQSTKFIINNQSAEKVTVSTHVGNNIICQSNYQKTST
ncbi:VanW family protein [Flavobacteriales bacterium]|nr:VanW family protein [Flavobacteriales bacterium]